MNKNVSLFYKLCYITNSESKSYRGLNDTGDQNKKVTPKG